MKLFRIDNDRTAGFIAKSKAETKYRLFVTCVANVRKISPIGPLEKRETVISTKTSFTPYIGNERTKNLKSPPDLPEPPRHWGCVM